MKITLGKSYSFCQQGQRNKQEDARYPDADISPSSERCYVVCDGVGGHSGGNIASTTVAAAFGRYMHNAKGESLWSVNNFKRAFDYAYAELYKAMSRTRNREMATTLTFIYIHAGGATMAHIGDSRIYQLRPSDGIIYKSEDHSLVNSLLKSGNISPEEAINHKQRNYITRCMCYNSPDATPTSAAVLTTKDVRAGDYFLLCTDGVHGEVSDEFLLQLLSSPDMTDQEKLAHLALKCRNSSDNNTATLLRVDYVDGIEPETQEKEEPLPAGANTNIIKKTPELVQEVTPTIKLSVTDKIKNLITRLWHK